VSPFMAPPVAWVYFIGINVCMCVLTISGIVLCRACVFALLNVFAKKCRVKSVACMGCVEHFAVFLLKILRYY
jgi:hypothetical protein